MKKVLVVDDAAFMRMAIRTMLEKNGYDKIEEAANGHEAIKKYKDFMPDIVTMDITMPELNGTEALKLILKEDPKANVVMISAMGQEDMVRESIMNGAKSFIVKPFKEEVVIKTFRKILNL